MPLIAGADQGECLVRGAEPEWNVDPCGLTRAGLKTKYGTLAVATVADSKLTLRGAGWRRGAAPVNAIDETLLRDTWPEFGSGLPESVRFSDIAVLIAGLVKNGQSKFQVNLAYERTEKSKFEANHFDSNPCARPT